MLVEGLCESAALQPQSRLPAGGMECVVRHLFARFSQIIAEQVDPFWHAWQVRVQLQLFRHS